MFCVSFQRNSQNPFHYAASLPVAGRASKYEEYLKFVVNLIQDKEQRQNLLNARSDRGTVLHIVATQTFDRKKPEVEPLTVFLLCMRLTNVVLSVVVTSFSLQERDAILGSLRFLIEECGADPTTKDNYELNIKHHVKDKAIEDYLTSKNRKVKRQEAERNRKFQESQTHMQCGGARDPAPIQHMLPVHPMTQSPSVSVAQAFVTSESVMMQQPQQQQVFAPCNVTSNMAAPSHWQQQQPQPQQQLYMQHQQLPVAAPVNTYTHQFAAPSTQPLHMSQQPAALPHNYDVDLLHILNNL